MTEAERLLEVAAGLYDSACELVLRGPWVAWDREQPAGAELEVTPAMLRETGDPNIRALVRIAAQLSRAAGQLQV